MKRYEKIIGIIEELEDQERKLENAREDNFAEMQKNPSNLRELENYDSKLLDMLIVLAKRVNEHKNQLGFVEKNNYDWSARIDDDMVIFRYKIMNIQEIERFTAWLNFMQEEVN
jgi:hypothetical protein